VFGHPLAQAVCLGLLGIAANVLSGAYVFQITETDAKGHQILSWLRTPVCWTFWALVLVLVLMGLYGWGMARVGRRTRKALTDSDVRDRALEVLLDPLLEQMKNDIDRGKLKSMPEIFAMLGLQKGKRQ
jgi:hypothetical protein